MKVVNSMILFLSSTVLFVTFGCKTTESESGVKDSNFSSADPTKPSIVLWLASDGMIHYGSCPVGSAVVDRNCPSLTETETPIKVDDYKDKLVESIKIMRPKSNNAPAAPDATLAQALLKKIDRIKSKLAAGGLSATETTNFQKQLDDLEIQYASARVGLSQEEQADLDKIMAHLDTKHITYDEGERLFSLALSPFTKGFSNYRLVITGGNNDKCAKTVVINELHLDLGSGLQPVTVATQTGSAKDAALVNGQALNLVASSIYEDRNSVGRAVLGTGQGFAPKAFLSNGTATSTEYLKLDFPNIVGLKAVAFGSGRSDCQLTSFRIEASSDGTNFAPVPGADFTGITYQATKQTFSW